MPKITKANNSLTITGTLAEHSLEVKTSQNGREFVRGQVVIDTSTEEGVANEVKVNVLQFADKKDKQNPGNMIEDSRYKDVVKLMDLIGSDVRVSASYNNSVFVQNGETRKGAQISGSFYSTSSVGTKQAKFKVTAFIKAIYDEEVNEKPTGNLIIDARVFNYNGTMFIPKKFVVDKDNAPALAYFRSANIGEGEVTDLWGKIENQTSTRIVESAFGEPTVEEGPVRVVAVITGARQAPYEMDEDLEQQVREAGQAYNVYVAQEEERAKEYEAQRATQSGRATTDAQKEKPKKGSFNF